MTESGCIGSITRASDIQKSEKLAYETIGQGLPLVEAKVIDPKTGQIVPRNVDGELCLRGFNIMRGYYDDPVKTTEAIDEHGLNLFFKNFY
jgi:fatty-acyl-CoA synthase